MDSYTEKAITVVRRLILDGHFKPGDRINEVELASSLGISRSRLREALRRFESEGLIHHVAHYGSFVPEFGVNETAELYELREALEGMAARLTAQRADIKSVIELREFLNETRAAIDVDDEPHYPRDMDFHKRIFTLAGNKHLAQRGQEVDWQLSLTRSRSAYRPDRARQAYKEHVAIMDAIEAGDPRLAEEAMRSHLRSSFANVRRTQELS